MNRVTISPRGKYCVYLHRYEETVFYVGQGRPQRPFEKERRHPAWQAMVASVGTYEVDIVFWTTDQEEALQEEARLIQLWQPSCNRLRPSPGTPRLLRRQSQELPITERDSEAETRVSVRTTPTITNNANGDYQTVIQHLSLGVGSAAMQDVFRLVLREELAELLHAFETRLRTVLHDGLPHLVRPSETEAG